MHTEIDGAFLEERGIDEARSIIRACVHCGFCNATCPTYLELGDERDGPRGRIYLIRQMLEGGPVSEQTQMHLDRCLTCRNCETTCPSGVEYGRLADIGRGIIERRVNRSLAARLMRWLLETVVPYPGRFGPALALGRLLEPLMPPSLRSKIPARQKRSARPPHRHSRTMLVLEGCVQAAATPNTNAAAARVLDRLGISLEAAPGAGCCGALSYHLGHHERGLVFMRRNIDAWWPAIERGADAIVVTASGCGATVRDYGRLLSHDPEYAGKAQRIGAAAKDLTEILSGEDLSGLELAHDGKAIAFHCPCTLQHAQKLPGVAEDLLRRLGFELSATRDPHICCGSAGAYSILQRTLGTRLRDRKLKALTVEDPAAILTANVGCQLHLASAAAVPVRHWIEAVDEALGRQASIR